MKKYFLSLIFLLLCGGQFLLAQQSAPRNSRDARTHNEKPEQGYLPPDPGAAGARSAGNVQSLGFFTVQVNVDANGNNIPNDAANEPSIAVDPTDPTKMVIGWRQFDNIQSNFRQAGYGYTVNGGQNWTFPGVIEPGVFRSDPVLEADSSGKFYYNSLTSNNDVFTCKVFRSSTGGNLWDAGVEAHGGDKQWMTIDRSGGQGDGNIFANWTSYYSSCEPGAFTRSTDGGNYYEDCIPVAGNPYWGTLTVGNNGELYVAGAGSGDGIVVVKSANAQVPGASINWDMTTQVNMDGYVAGSPDVNPVGLLGQVSIDVDRSNGPGRGNIYLVCSMVRISTGDPGDVMFAKSTDGGFTWSLPQRLNNDPTDFITQWFGTMSVAPNGRIDVVWLDTRDDLSGTRMSDLYYCYSDDQGETWSINKRLSDTFDPHVGWPQQSKMGDYFDMVSDNTGAHLAWANTLNGEQDVYYTHIIPSIVGIPEAGETSGPLFLDVYPNPVSSLAQLQWSVPAGGDAVIEVFDISGKCVAVPFRGTGTAGSHTVHFDASGLAPGYYTCRLTAGGRSVTEKLVRTR